MSRLPFKLTRLIYSHESRSFSVTHTLSNADRSASSKLFADAAEEERAEQATTAAQTISNTQLLATARAAQQRNWDGDESTEDAVLRMLVDKYKPLRTGTILSADEKLHTEATRPDPPNGISLDALPPIEMPMTFKGGRTGPRSKAKALESQDPDNAKARAETRRMKKLEEGPRRVGSALEKSLDYRIGKAWGSAEPTGVTQSTNAEASSSKPVRRPPPTLKGWAALVEERIETARNSGVFTKVSGRGKPLKQHTDEGNPFIPREEFLMNRIIQRQGAAPPWVEIQGELESHIRTFRTLLQSSWVRRATRNILNDLYSAPSRHNLSVASIATMRDPDWERLEKSYHETALDQVNAQIRRHNGIAPFAARRGYLMRQYELERCYAESAEEILRSVQEALERPGPMSGIKMMGKVGEEMGATEVGSLGIWEALKRLAARLSLISTSPTSSSPPSHETSIRQT